MIFKKYIPRDIRGVQDCIFYKIGRNDFEKTYTPRYQGCTRLYILQNWGEMIFKKHIPRDIRDVQDCIIYRIGENDLDN